MTSTIKLNGKEVKVEVGDIIRIRASSLAFITDQLVTSIIIPSRIYTNDFVIEDNEIYVEIKKGEIWTVKFPGEIIEIISGEKAEDPEERLLNYVIHHGKDAASLIHLLYQHWVKTHKEDRFLIATELATLCEIGDLYSKNFDTKKEGG